MEDKDKLFEVVKKNNEIIKDVKYQEIAEMLLNPNFNGLIRRLKIGEELYHNDKMMSFKRTK